MTKQQIITRRQFVRGTAAAIIAGPGLLGRSFTTSAETRPFEFLVVGDSLVWGGGLKEEHKFYNLTRDWLEREVFAGKRTVNLKNRSHSGATLTFHPNEAAAFQKAGWSERKTYAPEVNVSFPSIRTQLDIAADEYGADSQMLDLIMLSGGLTDITTAGILNPSGDNRELERDIEKYCLGSMSEVLARAGTLFPNAVIAVVGYFPILSPQTDTGRLFNGMLEAYEFPGFLKPLVNNPLVRPAMFKKKKKKAMVRSRIWISESDRRLSEAVDKFNAGAGKRRAIFIKGPVTEDTCFETPHTLLIRMGKHGRVDDFVYDQRKPQCDQALPELAKATGVEFPVRFCELASVGHPNIEGSRAYAETIEAGLGPLIKQ